MADLLAIHNLSHRKLRFAEEIGGLACPSIAYVRSDIPMQDFGEITLVADRKMANPGRSGYEVFDADTYTSRFPSLHYQVSVNSIEAILGPAQAIHEQLGFKGDVHFAVSEAIENDGYERLLAVRDDTLEVALWYLRDRGLIALDPASLPRKKHRLSDLVDNTPHLQAWLRQCPVISFNPGDVSEEVSSVVSNAMHEYIAGLAKMSESEDVSFDQEYANWKDVYWHRYLDGDGRLNERGCHALRKDQMQLEKSTLDVDTRALIDTARDLLAQPGESDRFQAWLSDTFDSAISRCYFIQRSASGRTVKKVDATLENIARHMKRTIRGGEDFNYGAGSIRAHVARGLPSWRAVMARSHSIVDTQTFDSFKSKSKDRLIELTEQLEPFYKYNSGRLDLIAMADILTDYARGSRGVIRDSFPNADDTHLAQIDALMDELRTAPTEYFEGKFKRAVTLDEFSVALVPEDLAQTDPDCIKRLSEYGLKVQTYSNTAHYKVLMKSLGREYGVAIDRQMSVSHQGPGL